MSSILLERAEVLIDAPVLCLSESVAQTQLSEGLMYHIQNKLPFYDNIYRVHSQAYYDLYAEARRLRPGHCLRHARVPVQALRHSGLCRTRSYQRPVQREHSL